jgi:glycine hydroxymethyltransferase
MQNHSKYIHKPSDRLQPQYPYDVLINELVAQEQARQQKTMSFIASENYTSQQVMRITGSVLTNKYAEGYPGKRYYAGCTVIDEIEALAIARCKQLFDAEHANVQPHAGCQANFAVYQAVLKPGDTLLGMSLDAGGHLTHGHGVNASGSLYNALQYGVDRDTELLDYDAVEHLAHAHKPKLIIVGASSYSRTIDFERFARIAHDVGALLMADIAHIAGLVAAHLHPSPLGVADFVTSTTHKTLRGPRGGLIMCKAAYAQQLDRAIIPGTQGGPLLHAIAAKAVAFYEALQPEFIAYQKQIVLNAQAMASTFANLGYRIVSGGTDNHMFVLDLRSKNITGLVAQNVLESIGLTVSRSCIPFDTQKPWITSGIRIGTPAMTTRGMNTDTAIALAYLIDEALQGKDNAHALKMLADQVESLALQHQVP